MSQSPIKRLPLYEKQKKIIFLSLFKHQAQKQTTLEVTFVDAIVLARFLEIVV
jgi:hypothetical protein